jgi:hypothetical protein
MLGYFSASPKQRRDMDDIKNKNKMITFKTQSHLYFEKGVSWSVSMVLLLLLLVALFVYLKQYLGAMVVIVLGVVLYTYSKVPAKEIPCLISGEGIKIGEQFYPYTRLKAFWIAQSAPYPILYLESAHRFKIPLYISLGNQPTEPIRRILLEHLPEKVERGEDIRDKVIRIFRF